MAEKIEHIGTKDIVWSYVGTAFMIGAGVLLLPFILNRMPQETVGIWNIFRSITALVLLLDFGFRPSFARNISYIFSGVKTLRREGVSHAGINAEVDYGLLKGTLEAMRRFYRRVAIAVFALLATAGTAYFCYIMRKYSGDRLDAMIAWVILIAINCYNLYTFYYDALLLGKGYVKRSQQINIISQAVYIGLAIGLICMGLGLTAIVVSQLVSIIIRRVLMYRVFYTEELRSCLAETQANEPKEVLSAITPNALKIGLTQLGGFLVLNSSLLIGSAFLSLEEIACYGITMQVMDVLSGCGKVFYQSYLPKLAQCRAEKDLNSLKRYYLLCIGSLWVIFIVGGIVWLLFGNWALDIIHSKTHFVVPSMLCAMLAINILENNHAVSAGFIMADNKIPFFIPSLLSGGATVVLLWVFLCPLHMGLWGLILAPGIAQLAYQNWKWPSVVINELWGKENEQV